MPFVASPWQCQQDATRFRGPAGLAALCARRVLATLFSFFLIALLAAILTGCGAAGEPVPRHPVTPQRVTDLAARQQGDAVVLTFTLPRNSTDLDPLATTPAVEIYRRGPLAPGATPPPKPPAPTLVDTIPSDVAKTYTRDGRFEFSDPLDPAEIARAPGAQRTYMVRTRVSQRRASDDSNSVSVPAYPAPEPISDLRATLTEPAVTLAWTPPQRTGAGAALAAAPVYRVYRAEVMPAAAPTASNPPEAQSHGPLQLLGPAPAAEYRDATFEFGHTYVYSVRGVTPVGAESVESADSNPVVVAAKDVFPPATPQTVVAALVPATTATPAYVDLTWAINGEADLAGYAVYRSDEAGAPGERLTPLPLPVPAFRDTSVAPARRYFYRVTALDRAGNESAPSDAVAVEIP